MVIGVPFRRGGGFSHAPADTGADVLGVFDSRTGKEHPEFVGGKAGNEIALSDRGLDDRGKRLHDRVGPLRTVAPADLVDRIDDDRDHHAACIGSDSLAPVDVVFDGRGKGRAVQRLCHAVVARSIVNRFLQFSELADLELQDQKQRKCNKKRNYAGAGKSYQKWSIRHEKV